MSSMRGTYQQYITVNADMMMCVLQTVTLKFLFLTHKMYPILQAKLLDSTFFFRLELLNQKSHHQPNDVNFIVIAKICL